MVWYQFLPDQRMLLLPLFTCLFAINLRAFLAGMSKSAIIVENLSKKYVIGHRHSSSGQKYQYIALRDVIGHEFRNVARKAADFVRGGQVIQGDEVEDFWALKDVSFEVKHGEVLGIIGRNGAGKSTLLKILSRITEPTNGRVILSGRIASLLEVGTGFHPELTGRENIFLNGAILGMTRREIHRKFDEIVAFAEVERFLDTPVKRYSSGMYVRLAFAVAAHLEPEILVVDEVLAVGDADFQRKCLGKMDEVSRKQGRTVLFVSHNYTAIRGLCTHGLFLHNGAASPKSDVRSALADYAFERQTSLASHWRRPKTLAKSPVHFVSINVHLENNQPATTLKCRALVKSEPGGSEATIIIHIADRNFTKIIQVVPQHEGFIGGSLGTYLVELSIVLPALIPGFYYLDFWMGSYAAGTFDRVDQAVTFEIVDSGDPPRSFTYSLDDGPVAPVATVNVSEASPEHELAI
jgi:lipopolysaccharide transport system ATP-binding protein